MKTTREHYEARMVNGSGALEDTKQTIEEIKRAIDESNERITGRGYDAEQYLIIHKVTTTVMEDGMLLSRDTSEKRVEIYPQDQEETPADAPQESPSWKTNDFWEHIPEDCEKAIKELRRLKVFNLCAWDYEQTFADVWWLVLHEVDMYVEGEYCREASRSVWGEGDPDAMNRTQAQRADAWLIRWNDLFNKYRTEEISRDDIIYDGQI
jgi:hypothetical protein